MEDRCEDAAARPSVPPLHLHDDKVCMYVCVCVFVCCVYAYMCVCEDAAARPSVPRLHLYDDKACMYACIHVCVCVFVFMYVCMYVSKMRLLDLLCLDCTSMMTRYVCMHAYMCVCVCVFVFMYVCMYVSKI